MAQSVIGVSTVDRDQLRAQISEKYRDIAMDREMGFRFHNGRPLARMLGYAGEVVETLPRGTVESFAGTGNPFLFDELAVGETVVDVGCGAGFDSFIAARQVGADGQVIAVDMTAGMRDKAAAGAQAMGLGHVEIRDGFAESLPVSAGVADVVISNGVSTCAPTSPLFSGRWRACSSPEDASRLETSSFTSLYRRMPGTTSTSGVAESPVLCWMQSGARYSN